MENRNYVNSENYAKLLLREKAKRESKVTKTQKSLQDQQKQQHLKPMCPKKPKKLPEKWLKQETYQKPEKTNGTMKNPSDNDLLSEIDNSLPGESRGFVYKRGN